MKYLYILVLFFSVNALAQLGSEVISKDLPNIVPPSPTVAALMKFEEVPVSNYTGVPNISIPLHTIPTHSKNVVFDLSLSYHPASIAANEIAAYTGLGWNLNAGGTISRTIRGYPDELDQGGSSNERKKGIYHSTNRYYEIAQMIDNLNNPAAVNAVNEYLWQVNEKGTYDSEHDLYQYNFMGYTGRFYISKQNGVFEVIRLDNDNTMKIEYNATANVFTLYNDKGIKFVFDVRELTTHSTDISTTYQASPPLISHSIDYTAVTAYHLSKIYDDGGTKIAELFYNEDSEPYMESRKTVHQQDNGVFSDSPADIMAYINEICYGENIKYIVPLSVTSASIDRALTKKIKRIDIEGAARIEFVLELGRSDTGISLPETNYRLKQVLVKDWNATLVKKFELVHGYSTVSGKRMILQKVIQSNTTDSEKLSYTLSYKANPSTEQGTLGTDYWGYYNFNPTYGRKRGRESHAKYCTIDVLQKMVLPTGGCTIFDFESNTYSHTGSQEVMDYYQNFDNWLETYEMLNFSSENLDTREKQLQLSETGQYRIANFYPTVSSGGQGVTAGFTLNRLPAGTSLGSLRFGDERTLYADSFYKIRFDWLNIGVIGYGSVAIYYYSPKGVNDIRKELHGGGIRIRTIGYFESSLTPQKYYESLEGQGTIVPSKEKNYNYNFFDDSRKSSGALVFAKPVFSYRKETRKHVYCELLNYVQNINYTTSTNLNNLLALKTQGADVGYKNVTVSERENGKSQYVYTNPIDFPEPPAAYATRLPFVPSKNYDYKRGLLQNEKHFRKDNKLLVENIFTYDIEESERLTGIKIFDTINCPFSYRHTMYSEFKGAYDACINNGVNCAYVCGLPLTYIGHHKVYEAFGWVKLSRKTSRSYYDNGGMAEINEEYTYHAANKKVATHKTITTASEFKQETYTYATFPNNKIGELSEIASYDQEGLLSVSRLNYSGGYPSNAAYLPASVDVSKGNEVLQPRLNYNGYDEFSNVLEVQLHDGTQTSYIWGYNKTQVIAKIENIGYANINAGLITAAQNASNTAGATGLEAALTSLRNSLPTAMVTTYTYKPMVGVSTVTDPKGDKVSYIYDAFGRLSSVKDKNGYILSLNNYNYRTQN